MSYLVFARKYRPQSFEDVVGQEHVARTLQSSVETDRVAHAYLFAGPRGVGKTSMARILSKALNCMTSPGPKPCGECEVCRGIAAGGDVDVLEIDAASNRSVNDVELLNESARYLPQRAPKKIFIVDETHMLSPTAFNALLKTLEEPPEHVLFILATTAPQKVPETVRSRCQRFDFKRISSADIERKLRRIGDAEGASVEDGVYGEIARRATGGLRDAETLFDQVICGAPAGRPLTVSDLVTILGGIPFDVRDKILLAAHSADVKEVLAAAEEVIEAGADPAELLRDLYGDLRDRAVAAALAEKTPEGPGVEWCLAAAELIGRHQRLAASSRAARAALDLGLLALARLGDVCDLEELVDRLEKIAGAPPASAIGTQPPPPPSPMHSPPPPPSPSPAPKALPPQVAQFLSRKRTPGAIPRPPEPPAPAAPPAGLEQKHTGPDHGPPRPASGHAPSSEEMQRIRSLPDVNRVLREFSGRIEHVRRDDGEADG